MNTPSTIFSFFHALNTQKQSFRNLKKLILIEAFEKLHKAFLSKRLKVQKNCFSSLKNCLRKKPLKIFIKLIFRINLIINSHNQSLYHEVFWSIFYHMHKRKLNQHINKKLLMIGNFENKKNRKKNAKLAAILKIFGLSQKTNNKRNELMKCFNRWSYL